MGDLNITDKYFDNNLTSLYHLSIQLVPDGFSFCIRDVVRNKYIKFREQKVEALSKDLPYEYYCQYFYDFLINEPLFKRQFKKVSILYHTQNATLVPLSIYDSSRLQQLFYLNFPSIQNQDIFSNRLNNTDNVLVFSMPECINKVLSRQFENYKVFHHGYPLIDNSLMLPKGNKTSSIYINVSQGNLDVCLIRNNELELYNNFSYTGENDIIYHVLNICDPIEKSSKPGELFIAGNILEYPSLLANFERYFDKVNTWRVLDDIKFSDTFLPLSLNKYSPLFSLYKCE